MATPETCSVEFDPLTPSFDGALNAVESEDNQVLAADTRELPPYSFDSDDKTLVGIGTSDSADSSTVRHFDSSDRTLVGIGPAERAKLAQLAQLAQFAQLAQAAELASHSQKAEPAPESIQLPHSELPHSEPPGPFVAGGDDEEAPQRLPVQKSESWVFALSAVLVAAAAVALLRGDVPHRSAPRLHSASTVAPLTAEEARTRYAQFETAAPASAETSAAVLPADDYRSVQSVEIPITLAPEAPQPAAPPVTAQREGQPQLAPRRATTKSAVGEPLGALDVTSNPPSVLVLDGRPVGKAPRVIQLPSGPHTVLFVHPERGRMSVTVNVRAGRTTTASADF
jgi:hypothetical protein